MDFFLTISLGSDSFGVPYACTMVFFFIIISFTVFYLFTYSLKDWSLKIEEN